MPVQPVKSLINETHWNISSVVVLKTKVQFSPPSVVLNILPIAFWSCPEIIPVCALKNLHATKFVVEFVGICVHWESKQDEDNANKKAAKSQDLKLYIKASQVENYGITLWKKYNNSNQQIKSKNTVYFSFPILLPHYFVFLLIKS